MKHNKLNINHLRRKIDGLYYKLYINTGKDAFKEGKHMLILYHNETVTHCTTYKEYKRVLRRGLKYGSVMDVEPVSDDFDFTKDGPAVQSLIDECFYVRDFDNYEDPEV